ncbi:hypothetical protein PA17_01673 [Pseudomonas aeruginosa]|uniref:hypothetical protein n=1 Tax=Pseudomonas aeruginosa TaxID=287 RepID=UPI000E0661FA|nr:hypothetical protein [Pseudomonas aeruginosa]RCM97811.1 hypothetical protein PA17_01673 [Pseudomonas aeruginosa]
MTPKAKLSELLIKTGKWILSLGIKLNSNSIKEEFERRLPQWRQLWFIVDIPLFSDSIAIEKLYDALNRPEFETKNQKTTTNTTTSKELNDELSLGGEGGIASFLKLSTTAKFGEKKTKTRGISKELSQEANRSTEMQIERIINHYAWHYADRIFWVKDDLSEVVNTDGKTFSWSEVSKLIDKPAPRPIIIFEIMPGAKIVPMAAETTNGKHVQISDAYILKIHEKKKSKTKIPEYSSTPKKSENYWESLEKTFDSNEAIKSIEDSTSDGSRIDWIDYRIISKSGSKIIPIHLHLTARGNYSTGTFAYQTVRRGYKHGIKIVGTLKKGEDINVLAIYEN